jgi:pyridoxamine 5'-phosphate oxidase
MPEQPDADATPAEPAAVGGLAAPPSTTGPARVPDPAHLRVTYTAGLLEKDLAATPLGQFGRWFLEVVEGGVAEPNAMVLATAAPPPDGGPGAVPSARTVLLKAVDSRGFAFYTNHGSRKGRELAANPWASLAFPWFAAHRQVVVVGRVEQVSREEAREYFGTRPYGSRLGAWASAQSTAIASREVLKARYAELAAAFPDTGSRDDVPLPEFWGGYVVLPDTVEFWAGRASRLHDRLRFVRTSPPPGLADGGAGLDDPACWRTERLSP